MATHNQARLIGYVTNTPKIMNEGRPGMEKVVFQMRTTRRQIESYHDDQYADVIILYDGIEIMDRMKDVKKYDILDIKGVVNILPVNKKIPCTVCGAINVKYTASTFIYPISATRLGSYDGYCEKTGESPDALLYKNYAENSNQVLLIGKVVTDPEYMTDYGGCCRYGLGVDRKYYIATQDDKTADYPWVYTYGEQAENDVMKLIKFKTEILVDGFIHNKKINSRMTCEHCGCEFRYQNVVTQITPYSVEYLNNYKTAEDLAKEAERDRIRRMSGY